MGIFSRIPGFRPKDPYWDAFINKPPADEASIMTPAIREAEEGRVYPVKSEVPEPGRMASDLAQLAVFLGARSLGVAAADVSYLLARAAQANDAEARQAARELVESHPYLVVCSVHAEHDPATAKGIGGQLPVQESASINFSLSAYIRELGYNATVRPVDSVAAAVAAGLGTSDGSGKLRTKRDGTHLYVGDAVFTDLPLALGAPDPGPAKASVKGSR